jgi:ABC-2 type transport system permease protein
MTTHAARLPRAIWRETHGEFLKLVRMPLYAIPVVLFPLMFYGLFGLSFGGSREATYLIASYGAFGVIGAGMFGLGVGVAMERGQGWLSLKRASPMPPIAYFASKVVISMTFGALITLPLGALGTAFGGVSLNAQQWFMLFATLTIGAAPFCALGCALAYLVGPNSAPAILNLIYLPMSFISGLWIPMEMLPKFVQSMAPAMPAYHLGKLAHRTIGFGDSSITVHILALAGFTLLFLFMATHLYRRDEGVTFG